MRHPWLGGHRSGRGPWRDKRKCARRPYGPGPPSVSYTHLGHAYYLDAGSTILTLTYFLHEGSYTVVTSAANTAAELAQKNRYNITLLGGQVSGVTLSCSGPQAEQMLDGMNIDVAIMAASGYSFNGGFTSGSLQEAQLKQRVIRKAACTMMLMDCGKIGRSHPFTFASLDDVDVLVGDSMLTPEFVREAEAHNVRVFSVNDGLTPEERSAITVSYTHLDVYKRQGVRCPGKYDSCRIWCRRTW